ncbi:MAG: methylmalonyl-CoA mutase family protein, partial [Acidobacteriota bacterium]
LQQETGICRSIDPWGGSYFIERLTFELARRAMDHIDEVEELGGMVRAIESGLPKMRIEEAAARTQARIDNGTQAVVGVNRYPLQRDEAVEVLSIDNSKVLAIQRQRLRQLRKDRDAESSVAALEALTRCAETGEGNLLAKSIQAAEAHCTVGEISQALERVFGRHQAAPRTVTGVYSRSMGEDNDQLNNVRRKVETFLQLEGRRPRILVAKIGQDGHDRGQKVIASAFSDVGFDVDVGPLFQTPGETARQAIENDVHIVGVSSLAAGHKALVPELCRELAAQGREDILVVVGGVVPPQDHRALSEAGVVEIFGPGTIITEAADRLLDRLRAQAERREARQSD